MGNIFTFLSRLTGRIRTIKPRTKAVILIILVLSFLLFIRPSAGPGYKTGTVTRGDVTETVSQTGMLVTGGKIDIHSPTTGFVESVSVQNEETVTQNQELFRVKSSATTQEKQTALADYLNAKSTLETAKATQHSLQSTMFSNWDDFRNLAQNDTYENENGTPRYENRNLPEYHIAEKNWLAAETNYKNQINLIAKAQAQLTAASLAYQSTQDAVVRSPVDGKVSNIAVTGGTSVKSNTPLLPAAPVLVLSGYAQTEAVFALGEDDINKISAGQTAEVSADAIPDHIYTGVVRRFDTIGTSVSGVTKFNVYLEITDPDPGLRQGMSVDATITTRKAAGVLTVPNAAVKPYKGGRAVRIPGRRNGDIEYIPVILGIRGEETTEITEGVEEGTVIILSQGKDTASGTRPFGF